MVNYIPLEDRPHIEGILTNAVPDNMGFRSELVHPETIVDVTKNYPRRNWSTCFSTKIREENAVKPWAHSQALGFDQFPDSVKNNKLMEPYDALI
jgi:cyanamide hydratase